jgi:hypothetical protein
LISIGRGVTVHSVSGRGVLSHVGASGALLGRRLHLGPDPPCCWHARRRALRNRRVRVNPPKDDPALSPTVQSPDITDAHPHTWTQACLYTVKSRSVDDYAGAASDQVPLVVQGNAALVYGPGWWYQNYRTGNPKINATTAQCYLDIVGQMSRVYQERFDASTTAGAKNYLGTSGQNDPLRLLGSQILASWLNFANGSLHWTQQVDTDCNGVNDATFSQVMHQVEDVFLSTSATKSQLLGQKAILACINGI